MPLRALTLPAIALTALSLLTALGCDDSGSQQTYDEDSFVDAYVSTMCELELRCYEDSSPFDSEQQCYDAAVDYGYFSFGEGCEFDAEQAAACIDEYERSGCIDYFNEEPPAACEAVFSGQCEWSELMTGAR
jgi:hypothetical protein